MAAWRGAGAVRFETPGLRKGLFSATSRPPTTTETTSPARPRGNRLAAGDYGSCSCAGAGRAPGGRAAAVSVRHWPLRAGGQPSDGEALLASCAASACNPEWLRGRPGQGRRPLGKGRRRRRSAPARPGSPAEKPRVGLPRGGEWRLHVPSPRARHYGKGGLREPGICPSRRPGRGCALAPLAAA